MGERVHCVIIPPSLAKRELEVNGYLNISSSFEYLTSSAMMKMRLVRNVKL